MRGLKVFPRALMLVTVLLALLGGLGSGLARLGWQMDSLSQDWILIHGPLMISGFLGTLICLERAVALESRYCWSILVPAINALGVITLLWLPDENSAKTLLMFGSLGLVGLFSLMLRLHPSRDIWIMATGAFCWFIGNSLWLLGYSVYQVVHLWTAFLILTIVGERLELSRVRRLTSTSEYLLISTVVIYVGGVLLTIFDLGGAIRLLGVGALLMAGWLLRYDIAGLTIRQKGLPRYIAACLLSGYMWLGFGGIIALWKGAVYAGPDYAVILHAFLLGFVFSMIFGHMPIIFPALTSMKVNYNPIFYGHLILLHSALSYRIYGGLTGNMVVRQQGGMVNAVAILLFLTVTISVVIRSNFQRSTYEG